MTIEQIEETVFSLIKGDFYYIEYPDNVKENLWKDGSCELKYMPDMGLDHLKACITMVKKNISDLKKSQKIEVTNIIKPLAEEKLSQLNNAFKRKSNK